MDSHSTDSGAADSRMSATGELQQGPAFRRVGLQPTSASDVASFLDTATRTSSSSGCRGADGEDFPKPQATRWPPFRQATASKEGDLHAAQPADPSEPTPLFTSRRDRGASAAMPPLPPRPQGSSQRLSPNPSTPDSTPTSTPLGHPGAHAGAVFRRPSSASRDGTAAAAVAACSSSSSSSASASATGPDPDGAPEPTSSEQQAASSILVSPTAPQPQEGESHQEGCQPTPPLSHASTASRLALRNGGSRRNSSADGTGSGWVPVAAAASPPAPLPASPRRCSRASSSSISGSDSTATTQERPSPASAQVLYPPAPPSRATSWQPPQPQPPQGPSGGAALSASSSSRAVRFSSSSEDSGLPGGVGGVGGLPSGASSGLGQGPPPALLVSRGSPLRPLRHGSDGAFQMARLGTQGLLLPPPVGRPPQEPLMTAAAPAEAAAVAAQPGLKQQQQQHPVRSISGDVPVRHQPWVGVDDASHGGPMGGAGGKKGSGSGPAVGLGLPTACQGAAAAAAAAAAAGEAAAVQEQGLQAEAAAEAGRGGKGVSEGDVSPPPGVLHHPHPHPQHRQHPHPHHSNGCSSSRSSRDGAAGPIRRAVELAPLPLPGAWDPELRAALACAAVQNAGQLAEGAALREADYGYARVVSDHQQQRELRLQEQQQQQPFVRQASPQRDRAGAADAGVGELITPPPGSGNDAPPHCPYAPATAAAAVVVGSGAASLAPRPPRPPVGTARSLRSALKGSQSSPCMAADPAENGAAGQQQPGNTSQPNPAAYTVPLPGASGTAAGFNSGPQESRHHASPASGKQQHGRSRSSAGSSGSGNNLRLQAPQRHASAGNLPAAAADTGSPLFTARGGFFARMLASASTSTSALASTTDGSATAHSNPSAAAPLDLSKLESVDVRIHCLTFNMGGVAPGAAALPEALFSGSYLAPDAAADAPELYVFATQESGPLAEWEAAVGAHLGRRYCRVAAESLMAIHILLFAVRPLAPHITEVRTSSVATGVGNVLGNKGGVAITFRLAGAQVLLVGSHFAAHDQYVERRNADFHRICAGLFAAPPPPPPTPPANPAAAQPQQQQQHSPAKPPLPPASSSPSPSQQPQQQQQEGQEGGSPGAPGGRGRYNVASGPTLSRFSRGAPPGLNGGPAAAAAASAVAAEAASAVAAADSESGAGSNSGPASRALTRALSASSTCSSSMASNAAALPGANSSSRTLSPAPSRSRPASFWSGLSFASAQQRQSSALLAHFDVVLWMGDLNYRIAGNPQVVKYAIDHNMVEVLWANDQLRTQQKKAKVLQGFHEMPIAFAPTFKFTPGTDSYELKRTPAWTDRVLYCVNADPLFADLKPLYYMSVPELRTSDHKPVIAGFELSISPQHAGGNRHTAHKGCVIS